MQHDWSVEQCLLQIRVLFGGKTKRPCFVLFVHWLIKRIANTYETIFQGHTKIALVCLFVLASSRRSRLAWRGAKNKHMELKKGPFSSSSRSF